MKKWLIVLGLAILALTLSAFTTDAFPLPPDPICRPHITGDCDCWYWVAEKEAYPAPSHWAYRACVDYHGMRFDWYIRSNWVVQPRPIPVSGGGELAVYDGKMPFSTIIAGVPTKIYLRYSGVKPYVTGVIHVLPSGGDTQWNIWFQPGPDGRFYLCNAKKGIFPGFWVDGGMNCH